MKNKTAKAKPTKINTAPVFEIAIRKRGANAKAAPGPKPEKRDNTFSKSRDTREDRGVRQMKTSNHARTLAHT